MRKAFGALTTNIPRPPFIGGLLPKFESVAGPVLLPTASGEPVPALKTPAEVLEALAPKLTREEELYALSIVDLAKQTLGDDAAVLISGDAVLGDDVVLLPPALVEHREEIALPTSRSRCGLTSRNQRGNADSGIPGSLD